MRPRAIARNVGRKVARGTLIACMIVPLATFVIYVKGKTAVYNKKLKARLKRRRDAAPTPLSTKEQVAAELRMAEKSKSMDGTLSIRKRDQSQSLFFRLPPEIRQLVYRELMADKVFHIERGLKRLSHTKCQQDYNAGECACNITTRTKDEAPWQLWRESSCKACATVPLLQTCRKIYDEAIDLLYSQNRFVFDHLDTLRYFSVAVLPNHLRLISSVQLSWSFAVPWYNEMPVGIEGWLYPPYDEVSWMELWRTIAGMRGLKKLHLRVYDSARPRTAESQRRILAPLNMVEGLDKFVVSLPSNWFHAVELQDEPYKIVLQTPFASECLI